MEEEVKILILEDVDEDAELIIDELKRGEILFQFLRVDNKKTFEEALQNHTFDVILSDHSIPNYSSSEAIVLCQQMGLSTPFILVTGTVSEEFAVHSLKRGAADYILKDNLSRLPNAVRTAIENKRLQEQRLKHKLALHLQNDKLKKINKELDSFVYSVSHNLRSPLMSILGLINIARHEDSQKGNSFKPYFDRIDESIHKLDDTLKEILEYSKNSRNESDFKPLSIDKIVNECLNELRYIPQFSKIKIHFSKDGDTGPFVSDEYRFTIILRNLLSNSIKYLDEMKSDPYLHIHFHQSADEGFITVEDNGIGIKSNLLPNITNMFFRGTEKSHGAGLGLYIVKEAAEKMKGQISINSFEGVGTRVTITLPNHRKNLISPTDPKDQVLQRHNDD